MKNKLIGLLLLISLSVQAQWTDKDTSFQLQLKEVKADRAEKWKVIGLYAGSIILNGIGDAKNDMNQKTVGHLFNAASVGTLVLSPAIFNYKKDKWYLYVISYTLLRAALFDVTYNLTRGLPYNYTGSTSITDKAYNYFGGQPTFVRGVFLIASISIPLNNL